MPHFLLADLEPFDHAAAITLTDAAKLIRGRKGRLHRAVAGRWARAGYACRGWTGPRLVLPSVLIGVERWTMPQWVAAFESARVEMSRRLDAGTVARPRTERAASAGHRRAVAELRKAGFSVRGAA